MRRPIGVGHVFGQCDRITVENEGDVGQIAIAGGVVTNGNNSDAIHTRDKVLGLVQVSIDTANRQDIVRTT